MGDKRAAGHPDDARAGPAGLGVRRHQLPAEPQGHLARPHRRLQAGGGLGPGAHRRVRGRPRVSSPSPAGRPGATFRRCWPSPRTSPTGSPASRTLDTSVDACIPFYGVYDMTGGPRRGRGLRARTARAPRAAGDEDRRMTDNPALFEQASPDHRVTADGTAHVRVPRGQRHPGAAWPWPGTSSTGCARSPRRRWPTSSFPGPSTPSTCWPRSGAGTPPWGRSGSWRGCGPGPSTGRRPDRSRRRNPGSSRPGAGRPGLLDTRTSF